MLQGVRRGGGGIQGGGGKVGGIQGGGRGGEGIEVEVEATASFMTAS